MKFPSLLAKAGSVDWRHPRLREREAREQRQEAQAENLMSSNWGHVIRKNF